MERPSDIFFDDDDEEDPALVRGAGPFHSRAEIAISVRFVAFSLRSATTHDKFLETTN
jgi:hypothetical protein